MISWFYPSINNALSNLFATHLYPFLDHISVRIIPAMRNSKSKPDPKLNPNLVLKWIIDLIEHNNCEFDIRFSRESNKRPIDSGQRETRHRRSGQFLVLLDNVYPN